ncbi:MAG: FG-GAP repeat domain-containing protein, partial [Phycisphaerae bacterium]
MQNLIVVGTILLLMSGMSGAQDCNKLIAPKVPMVERLRNACDALDPEKNVYLNRARAAVLEKQLAEQSDIQGQINGKLSVGIELLRCGEVDRAIALFEEVRNVAIDPAVKPNPKLIEDVTAYLASAYLRVAELENCCARHTPESCIWPLQGAGKHGLKRGAEKAATLYRELLRINPRSPGYAWLLNLSCMALEDFPNNVPEAYRMPPNMTQSDYDIGRFHDVASAAGVDHQSLAGGVCLEDFDQDGFLDLLVSGWGIREQAAYFHNRGDGTFEDRTTAAGLSGLGASLNMVHADYDNDGDADVLMLRGGWQHRAGLIPNSLLRNNGDGTFTDVTEEAGLLSFHPTQVGVWGDFDNDGWLDLFIGNESAREERHPCEFFHNNRDGTFTNIAAELGLDRVALVKGAAAADYDNDGHLDLYISQFFARNVLLKNIPANEKLGLKWQFADVTATAGVAEPVSSFPAWFFDFDHDGWEDIFIGSFASFVDNNLDYVVADMAGAPLAGSRCTLYRNNRNGTFTNVAKQMKVDRLSLVMGANFGDLDNDGWLDIYLGTGQPQLSTLIPNQMFRNDAGKTYQNVTISGGFGHLQKGHGIAFGDIDNDGDQDIYAVMGGAFETDVFPNTLFENPGHGNNWITLKFVGAKSNRCAIGTRLRI